MYGVQIPLVMNIGVLFSGGKDSTFTLSYYLQQGWDVKCLITLLPSTNESWMFQTSPKKIIELQSKSLGIPVVFQRTKGEKEKELFDLEHAIQKAKQKYNLEGIAVGALASDYQQERVNRICHKLKLKCFNPLWHKDPEKYLREIVAAGFKVIFIKIAALGFTEKWLGTILDENTINNLKKLKEKYGVHIGLEGGEGETLVIDGPIFKKKVKILSSEIKMESNCCGEFILKKVKLENK